MDRRDCLQTLAALPVVAVLPLAIEPVAVAPVVAAAAPLASTAARVALGVPPLPTIDERMARVLRMMDKISEHIRVHCRGFIGDPPVVVADVSPEPEQLEVRLTV